MVYRRNPAFLKCVKPIYSTRPQIKIVFVYYGTVFCPVITIFYLLNVVFDKDIKDCNVD